MGGIGSGGSRKTPAYQLVERFSRVDINRLRRLGFIPKGAEKITFQDAILPVVWRKQTGCTTGDRAFFQCPRCNRSVWKLYRKNSSDSWKCRQCHGLMYRSSLESGDTLSRSACRAYKIRVRLGSPDTFHLAAIPAKPPRMRWKTYDRLLEKLYSEYQRSTVAMSARLKQITGRDLPLA